MDITKWPILKLITFFEAEDGEAVQSQQKQDLELIVQSFSILEFKEYNQSDFDIDHLVMSMCRVFSCVIERRCSQCVLLAKLCQTLPCFILYSKAKFACYYRYLLTSCFCIPIPYDERTFVCVCVCVCVSSKRSSRSSQNCSASTSLALVVGAQTWITVILNGLPWKQTEIILLFLRSHPSMAFQTLLLTMMATPFILRDSCQQQQI